MSYPALKYFRLPNSTVINGNVTISQGPITITSITMVGTVNISANVAISDCNIQGDVNTLSGTNVSILDSTISSSTITFSDATINIDNTTLYCGTSTLSTPATVNLVSSKFTTTGQMSLGGSFYALDSTLIGGTLVTSTPGAQTIYTFFGDCNIDFTSLLFSTFTNIMRSTIISNNSITWGDSTIATGCIWQSIVPTISVGLAGSWYDRDVDSQTYTNITPGTQTFTFNPYNPAITTASQLNIESKYLSPVTGGQPGQMQVIVGTTFTYYENGTNNLIVQNAPGTGTTDVFVKVEMMTPTPSSLISPTQLPNTRKR